MSNSFARVCRLSGIFIALVLAGNVFALNAPTALSATSLKATSFTLKWSAATGASGGIAGYDIYKNGALLGSGTARSFNVTGLAPTTSYTMTVVARDNTGMFQRRARRWW